jgi:hypothetical protein
VCKWEFAGYHPSAVEEKWFADIDRVQERVCEATAEIPADDIKLWLDYAAASVKPLALNADNTSMCENFPPASQEFNGRNIYDVMSSLEYTMKCPGRVSAVFSQLQCSVLVMLIVDYNCSPVLLLLMGCCRLLAALCLSLSLSLY